MPCFASPGSSNAVVVERRGVADVAAQNGRLLWRVTFAMLRSSTLAVAATVACPARSECPKSSSGEIPVAWPRR
jgi:hypothetical protein